jgi:hypothetical protein
VIDKSKLTRALERLEAELLKSGKIETAEFFNKAITTVDSKIHQENLKEFLGQLCSSAAITQYADFSYSEDKLFDEVYEEAKKLLALL